MAAAPYDDLRDGFDHLYTAAPTPAPSPQPRSSPTSPSIDPLLPLLEDARIYGMRGRSRRPLPSNLLQRTLAWSVLVPRDGRCQTISTKFSRCSLRSD